jgi:hypothetical protein
MKKTIIMSVAVIGSILSGDALMAAVFAFVMVTGLLAGGLMNESARRFVECPVSALMPALKRLRVPPSA